MSVSMPKAPRLTQERRSFETRARLIDATIQCIAENGFAKATTAEISARAGVSSGARVHHFKSKLDLVIAVVRFTYELATTESLKVAEAADAQGDPLRRFIEDAYRFYSGPHYLFQHEVVNAARTSAELMQVVRPAADAYRAAVNAAWSDVFRRAGYSRRWSRAAMDLSLAIVRGLAAGSLLRGRVNDDEILKTWHAVMASHPDAAKGKRAQAQGALARRE
jgi:AcrR family transcriptional regulator